MDQLKKLARIHHVTYLLSRFLQVKDPILAEFLIDIASRSRSSAHLHQQLQDQEADLPPELTDLIFSYLHCKTQAIPTPKDKNFAQRTEKRDLEIDETANLSVKLNDLPPFLKAFSVGIPPLKANEGKEMLIPTSPKRSVPPNLQPPNHGSSIPNLPVMAYKDQLLQLISKNKVLVVVGETGSGKSTLIPQFLLEASHSIAVTQPRRVAATSIARHVASIVGCTLGKEVGYSVRFDDCSTPGRTKLKYLTDGMLLREMLTDPLLSPYSTVIVDEAHERTLNSDIIMGLLKDVLEQRSNFRLLITSATMDASKFSVFFQNAPIFTIPGRTWPVEIVWNPVEHMDYLTEALVTTMKVHLNEPPGDILVFLTGQEEIDSFVAQLFSKEEEMGKGSFIAVPAYAALNPEAQSRIFDPAPKGKRKIVVATNIAETSITIDGILYVIDSGMVKQKAYNPRQGMEILRVVRVSQAQANQRSGRAGRTAPGRCYRLYSEKAFQKEMLPSSIPEIQRANLANTVLSLKAIGIEDAFSFPFIDAPSRVALSAAMQELYWLGALDEEGLLTLDGRTMASLPLDPPLAKMLLCGKKLGCLREAISIAAMLSLSSSPFLRPLKYVDEADRAKSRFHHTQGDHLTLLNLYESFSASGSSSRWAHDRYVNAKALLKAQDIAQQLAEYIGVREISSCGGASKNPDLVLRAVAGGFFERVAKRASCGGDWSTLCDGQTVFIHPSSCLFGIHGARGDGGLLLYHELVQTSKEWMRIVSWVRLEWLLEADPEHRYFDCTQGKETKLKPLGFPAPKDTRAGKRRPAASVQRKEAPRK